jgi:hypothetical protein
MMKVTSSSETSVATIPTQRHIAKDGILQVVVKFKWGTNKCTQNVEELLEVSLYE